MNGECKKEEHQSMHKGVRVTRVVSRHEGREREAVGRNRKHLVCPSW